MVATSINLSPNKYEIRNEPVSLIVLHTAEAPERADTAEAVANYFKNPATKASAHWCVDSDSRVRCVYDTAAAWAVPPVNNRALSLEFAGYANQTTVNWMDPYSLATLDVGALCVAEWCDQFDIPIRRLGTAALLAGEKGIAGHADVNQAFRGSTHTDPGAGFPWDYFLARVAGKHPFNGNSLLPSCVELQRAVRTPADNKWGEATDRNGDAVVAASAWDGIHFPYGVKFTQGVVGTIADGNWGPRSAAAHTATVKNMQLALKNMGFKPGFADGVWGPATNAAYEAARSTCHI